MSASATGSLPAGHKGSRPAAAAWLAEGDDGCFLLTAQHRRSSHQRNRGKGSVSNARTVLGRQQDVCPVNVSHKRAQDHLNNGLTISILLMRVTGSPAIISPQRQAPPCAQECRANPPDIRTRAASPLPAVTLPAGCAASRQSFRVRPFAAQGGRPWADRWRPQPAAKACAPFGQ